MKPQDENDFAGRLNGVRVAITGGTSGLGLALVHELHRRGAHVAFIARTAERVAEVARANRGMHGIVGDVARKEDIHPIALQVLPKQIGAMFGKGDTSVRKRPRSCSASTRAVTRSPTRSRRWGSTCKVTR